MVYLLFIAFLFYGNSKAAPLEPMQNYRNPSNRSITMEPSKSLISNIVSNPKLLVSEVSNLDPVQLRKIITLLENMKATSVAREKHLVDKVNKKKEESFITGNAVADAEAAVRDAESVVALRQQELSVARNIHDAKIEELHIAQQELDDEIDSLNDEQSVLSDVILMLEELHGRHKNLFSLDESNWIFDGVNVNNGVVTGAPGPGFAQTKATFQRPLEVSWTSRQVDGHAECVVFNVFPQDASRHSGYNMGYGWWTNQLSYGINSAIGVIEDGGDNFQNHVYKMELPDAHKINFYRDDQLYFTTDNDAYQSGVIRFGNSCVNWEVSAFSIKEL